MKDFVRDVWKIAAACGSGAFLLSLVIGLVAGNPFGVVFFRALLLAVLFAGLGAGLRRVVKAYLPELIALNSAPPGTAEGRSGAGMAAQPGAKESAGYRGAAVDIVLQDDDGLRRQAFGGSGRAPRPRRAESEAGNVEEEADAALEAALSEDIMSQGDGPELGELAEELSEELPPAQEATGPDSPAAGQSSRDSVDEMESRDELPRAVRDEDPLPEIADLEPPEEKPPRAPVRPLRPAAGERPEEAARNALIGQDPSTLARAIRTVLKNAEKG